MGFFTDLLGTVKSSFKVGKTDFDASGVTANRSLTVPDKTGVLATISDIYTPITQMFVQPTAPTPPGIPYIWFQTGLGPDGKGVTIWVEDGASVGSPTGQASYIPRRVLTINGASGVVNCNWALYDEVRVNMVGNVSLGFSGAVDGQPCVLKVSQDAVGSRLLSLPASVRYNADITAYSITAAPNKKDRLGFLYDAGDAKFDFVSVIKGI